jgi:hypothetical protein
MVKRIQELLDYAPNSLLNVPQPVYALGNVILRLLARLRLRPSLGSDRLPAITEH